MNAERLLALYERIADAPDAVARLRRFVLDLALRGKLVAQDPNDEPSTSLLARIRTETARLVDVGEIGKQRPLPRITEPPLALPSNWTWTRIRDVTTDRKQKIPQAPFTYIDVTAIDKEAGVIADPKVLQANEAPSRARKTVRRGDVIYSCVRPYLLNVAVIEDDLDPEPIASTAFAVLNGHGFVLPRYTWIVLRSPFMVECVEGSQRGQAYPAINDSDFAMLPFPLPPLAEQHRIVAKVDELMALCDRLEAARAQREATRDRLASASLARLNAPDPDTFRDDARFALDTLPALTTRPDQITQLRQTILNLAVRGRLVPQDPQDGHASHLTTRIASEKKLQESFGRIKRDKEHWDGLPDHPPYPVPDGWAWVRLQDVFEISRGGSPRPAGDPLYFGGAIPWITVREITKDDGVYLERTESGITELGATKSRFIEPGDLLLTNSGATLGVPKISRIRGCINDGVAVLRRFHPVQLERFAYLYLCSQTQSFREVNQGMGQPNLNTGIIAGWFFPLPPLAEQHRIVAKVDELMALCDQLEASLAQGDTARRRLLDALLAEALAPDDEGTSAGRRPELADA